MKVMHCFALCFLNKRDWLICF